MLDVGTIQLFKQRQLRLVESLRQGSGAIAPSVDSVTRFLLRANGGGVDGHESDHGC
jgi:hypothetical protein